MDRGMNRRQVRRADFHRAAVAAARAAGHGNFTARDIAEGVARFQRDAAGGAAAGGSIAVRHDFGIRPQTQRVGGDKFDDAVLILHGVGLNEAALVHHPGVQRDGAAVGDDVAVIVHGALRQRDLHAHAAAVGSFAQRHRLAGGETDAAAGRLDAAVVFNFVGDEKSRAAVAHLDAAVVHDAGERRRAVEFPGAAGVLRRRAVRGGDDQAGGADKRVRPEIKARRVHQHHDAVGLQAAVNLRRALAVDLVDHHGIGVGLVEHRALAVADVEALPVEKGVL